MSAQCGRRFDEELLSGYVDDALSQGDRQRVDRHLEECPSCRALVDQIAAVHVVARGTRFRVEDLQWSELPRTGGSRALRRTGWLLLALWGAALASVLAWQLVVAPEPLWHKALILGGVSGIALLGLSVLLDRLHDLKTDRYRRVQR
jgi:anti-sigma factor RsiW